MGVCNLMSPLIWQSVPFADSDAFRDFNGVHAQWHRVMAQATRTPYFLIDDLRNGSGLERHSQMHDAVDKALGIAPPYDLVSFNLFDRESYYGFMALHANETQRQRVALGI